jgi:excisionase family DNA binding protein
MDDYLTSRQVQDLLKVDRITVYRMLQDGRLQGVKIGQQWRFTRAAVERILQGKAPASAGTAPADSIFPIHCVQTIQDLFSDVSQISAVVLDHAGEAVTRISHLTPFCEALLASPTAREAYQRSWREFARHARAGSRYFTGIGGLQYVAAPIVDQGEFIGLFLTGPFYTQTPDAREEADRLRQLAQTYGVPFETLQAEARSIPIIQDGQRAQLEAWPHSAARAVQSILRERTGFVQRLQKIANLTQI